MLIIIDFLLEYFLKFVLFIERSAVDDVLNERFVICENFLICQVVRSSNSVLNCDKSEMFFVFHAVVAFLLLRNLENRWNHFLIEQIQNF